VPELVASCQLASAKLHTRAWRRLPSPLAAPRHEPRLALHGGEGLGIDCLLPICTGAARRLQPGGFLALETAGGEQAHYIADLLAHMRCSALADAAAGLVRVGGGGGPLSSGGGVGGGEAAAFRDVRVRKDLRGVDRFVTATRAAPPSPASSSDAA
jgi:release factor glutamine methyltransferase